MQINLIAPPLYVVTTQTLERSDGIQKLTEVIEKIRLSIEKNGGVFAIKMPVCIYEVESMFISSLLFLLLLFD